MCKQPGYGPHGPGCKCPTLPPTECVAPGWIIKEAGHNCVVRMVGISGALVHCMELGEFETSKHHPTSNIISRG